MDFEVIILNDYANRTGGSSAVALDSALGLAQRGIQVTLFTAVGPVPPEIRGVPNLEVICLDQPEIAHDTNRVRAFVHGVANASAARALEVLLSKKDPRRTIVHVHTYTKALSPLAIDAAVRRGFPVVLTLHDYFISCPSGGLFVHQDSTLCERRPMSWDCVTCNCDRRHYAHKVWRVARTFYQNSILHLDRRISCYVGVAEFSAGLLRPYLPPEIPVRVIRNPVDCVDRGPAPVAENEPVLFIGRFSREKGVLLLAEAVRKLGAPAVFIGDGELLSDAREICPSATFTGWLAPSEVNAWLRRARALVFPPLWYETLGLVAIEAAANGVPVILSNRCAAKDFITHGERGLHFAHGSIDSLCEQIEKLRSQPALAAQIGKNAYDWYWRDPWTVERHAQDLSDLYEELLAGKSQSKAAVEAGA